MKPLLRNLYNGVGDPNDHLDNFDLMLHYRGARDAWFGGLGLNLISYWSPTWEFIPHERPCKTTKKLRGVLRCETSRGSRTEIIDVEEEVQE